MDVIQFNGSVSYVVWMKKLSGYNVLCIFLTAIFLAANSSNAGILSGTIRLIIWITG